MRFSPHCCRLGTLVVIVFLLASPHRSQAHGETLLRIAALTQQIQTSGTNVAQLYVARGDLHREHQDWTAAAADYAQAAKLEPGLSAALLGEAALLVDTGHLDEAEATYTKVIARSPQEGEAFIGRAGVRVKLDHRKAGIDDFQHGLERLRSPQPEYFLELAHALADDSRSTESLRILDDGIKRLGPLVPLQEYAFQLELEHKDLEAALRRVDKILKVVSREESWLVQRGDILLLAHRPTEAQQSFKAALRAIDALPRRLQQSPAVLQLIDHVRARLAQLNSKPLVTSHE